MQRIVNLFIDVLLIFTIILVFVFDYMSSASYITFYIPFLLLGIFVWLNGMHINKVVKYRRNISIYFIIYFIALFVTVFLINRFSFSEFNIDIHNIRLIPFSLLFETVLNIDNMNISGVIFNYLGNFLMLIPFSVLLIVKNGKNYSYKKMFIHLFLLTFIIESLQLIINAGQFDIDDFIFNILGGMLSLFIIRKFNLFNLLNKLFYSNLNINKIVLRLLLFIVCSFIIFIDVFFVCKIVKLCDYASDSNYIRGLYAENHSSTLMIDDYEIYFDDVIVVYKDQSDDMYELEEDSLNISYHHLINLLSIKDENENYITYLGKDVYGYECKNMNRLTFTTYSYNPLYCSNH